MEDREKVLRWNLREAINEMDKPLDVAGMIIGSMAFGIMTQRQQEVDKCWKELDEYLKNKESENAKDKP